MITDLCKRTCGCTQELACLWDWQHRRVAAGLPHEWTPKEEEAARKAAIAQAEKVR